MRLINCKNYSAIKLNYNHRTFELYNDDDVANINYTYDEELVCSIKGMKYCYIGLTVKKAIYCYPINKFNTLYHKLILYFIQKYNDDAIINFKERYPEWEVDSINEIAHMFH